MVLGLICLTICGILIFIASDVTRYLNRSLLATSIYASFIPKTSNTGNIDRENLWVLSTPHKSLNYFFGFSYVTAFCVSLQQIKFTDFQLILFSQFMYLHRCRSKVHLTLSYVDSNFLKIKISFTFLNLICIS